MKPGPSFEQIFKYFPKDALCHVWLKLRSGSWEEDENVKVYDDDNENVDDRQQTSFDQEVLPEP